METELKRLRRLYKFPNEESYNDTHLLILINRRKHLISQLNRPINIITELKVIDTNPINLSLYNIIKNIRNITSVAIKTLVDNKIINI